MNKDIPTFNFRIRLCTYILILALFLIERAYKILFMEFIYVLYYLTPSKHYWIIHATENVRELFCKHWEFIERTRSRVHCMRPEIFQAVITCPAQVTHSRPVCVLCDLCAVLWTVEGFYFSFNVVDLMCVICINEYVNKDILCVTHLWVGVQILA